MNNITRGVFIAGFCVLGFALVCSFLAGVGTIGEEWRTVGILRFNGGDVSQWERYILGWGVLPSMITLILLAFPFVLGQKIDAKWEKELCLFFGILSFAFGVYYLFSVYLSYSKALDWMVQTNVTYVAGSLTLIYVGFGCNAVLWLVTGLFLLFVPLFFGAHEPH